MQKDVTADLASRHDPVNLTKDTSLKDSDETKGHVHDELLKDIDTQKEDVATNDMLYVLPTRVQQLLEMSTEVVGPRACRPGPLL